MIRIEFDLTEEKYITYNNYCFFHEPSLKCVRIYYIIFFPILITLLIFLYTYLTDQLNSNINILKVSIFNILYLLILIVIFKQILKSTINKKNEKFIRKIENRNLLGFQILEIFDDKISIKNEYKESNIRWIAINKLTVADKFYMLNFTSTGGFPIPFEAFNDDNQKREFELFCNEKVKINYI
jgi:hypothetical protein